MHKGSALIAALMACAAPVFAQSDDDVPLSAIDWLSETVEQPETIAVVPRDPRGTQDTRGTRGTRIPPEDEDPVASSATTPSVSVQTLGGPAPRVIGVIPPEISGLPAEIWTGSDADTLAALMMAQQVDTLPALQNLVMTLAMAQANPPFQTPYAPQFIVSRIDKLLDFGALEPALSMLEITGTDNNALFRRWFDVALLTGTENRACRALRNIPDIAPTPAARIFCLARSGDWSAAALTLNTSHTLGDLDDDTAYLLARFLDPDLFEDEPPLTPPTPMTPLTFRMFEAIGDPQTTQGLPRAFSHADLRPNVGWKAQLEAAERLTRSSAISESTLIDLYTARVPAASGGVWERAKAVNALDAALNAEDPDEIAEALTDLWSEARPIGATVALAQYFAPRLLEAEIAPRAYNTLFSILLLSDQYETAALNADLAATNPFLAALAKGDPSEAPATRPTYPVLQEAFATDPIADLVDMSANGQTGEAILRTIATVQQGLDGDRLALREGLATLRALGLEDVARRAALQYAILPS